MNTFHTSGRRPLALRLSALALALLAAGCSSLAPNYERPAAPVPAQLPLASAAAASAPAGAQATVRPLTWQELVRPAPLRQLIEQALANNRDLRVAALNVERAKAQLGVAQADRYPTVGAGFTANRAPNTSTGQQATTLTAGLQISSWELDFFGRIASLSDAAKAQLLSSEAGRRSAELTLVGAVVSGWLALAADADLAQVTERTLASRDETLRLTKLRADVGAASQLELQSAESLAASARVAALQLQRQREQDLNALALLVGGPVPAELLPQAGALDQPVLAEVPVGLSSEVLLARPDVVQAEQALIAANANIGAARAAFFPRVTLTASAGQAASTFSDLFQAGHFAWTLGGQALMSIFDAGRNQANLDAAKVSREITVAQYEKAVQSAFRDTADALAGLATWRDQLQAQQRQLDTTREISRLTELRYSRGAASELERQDAQRSLLATEQAVAQTRLAEQVNRVTLWKALGG